MHPSIDPTPRVSKFFFIPNGILDALETNPLPPLVEHRHQESPKSFIAQGRRNRESSQESGESCSEEGSRRKEGIGERNGRTIDGIEQIEIHTAVSARGAKKAAVTPPPPSDRRR